MDADAHKTASEVVEHGTKNWEGIAAALGMFIGAVASRLQLGKSARGGTDSIVKAIQEEGSQTRQAINQQGSDTRKTLHDSFDRLHQRVDDLVGRR